MERSGKRKRRRRRRSKGKERGDASPALVAGAPSTEAADHTSKRFPFLQEVQADCDWRLQTHHPGNRHGSRPVKRKRPLCQSHLTCRRAAWAGAQKNAVVQLNELRPGLRYEVATEAGPLHAPLFSVGVEVHGLRFEGRGPTKKQAKMRAAELALRSFVQFPNGCQAHAQMQDFAGTPADLTADKLDGADALLRESEGLLHGSPKKEAFSSHRHLVHLTMDLVSSTAPKRRALCGALWGGPGPVALLNELRPGLRYKCLVESAGGRLMRSFVMVVRVEGRVFEGCGHSKRRAKAQAAANALQALYDLGAERKAVGVQRGRTKHQLPQFFAEAVVHLVRQKYAELTDSDGARHKALAGIVMTRGFDLRSARVVSLATGTKCLDNAGDRGSALGDCHAEVLSRRALLRFLYSQLELLLWKTPDGEEQSIFVPNGGGGLRLQGGVFFHMYVSSSPCGDARLNCPYETAAAYPSRRFRSHLRAKVNGGEGTLPVPARGGDPNRDVTMSCTDKMAKWSVVGLQGALLSHLVEPVYLHSLTVATLSHTGHLGRALTRRLAAVTHLPFPYRRRPPLLGCLSEARPAGGAPSVSLNWSCGDGGVEEIGASTGRRRDSGTPSQLCRSSLFERWLRLQRQTSAAGDARGTYAGSKLSARRYQRALQQFAAALQATGLGPWRRKSPQMGRVHVSE